MKISFRVFSMACIVLVFAFTGCKKDNDDDSLGSDNIVAQDNMEASSTSEDVSGTVQQMMDENQEAIYGRMALNDTIVRTRGVDNCATVTIIRSQKKITVDFGTSGCQGLNGRSRKGKWIITYSQHWRHVGAVVDVAFENFAFKRPNQSDYITVANTSTKRITTTANADGIFEFTKEINLVMTLPTGQTRTLAGTRYVTWNTNNTPDRFNDIITIKTNSTETGTDRKGRAFQVVVLEPVVINTACWLDHLYKPVSGKIQINKIGKAKTITFGDGSCGGVITIEVNGKQYTIGENE